MNPNTNNHNNNHHDNNNIDDDDNSGTSDSGRSGQEETFSSSSAEEGERNARRIIDETLNPTPVLMEHGCASGKDVHIAGDINSMLIMCTSLEPFKCTESAQLSLRSTRPAIVRNKKATLYLNKRRCFAPLRRPSGFSPPRDVVKETNTWYEFSFLSIDNRTIYAAFQMDHDSPFFNNKPARSTFDEEGRLLAACTALINGVVVPAAQRLPIFTFTARTGLAHVVSDVDRTYTIVRRDYATFAANFTAVLSDVQLKRTCGMHCIRFYICRHGLRLEKHLANDLLRAMCNVDHVQIEIIQIHRADTIFIDNDEDRSALLVNLDGGNNDDDSLLSIFRGGVNIAGKTNKYRVGFLFKYGFFDRHSSIPSDENTVTYVQAYNSAAKMARPRDCGLTPAYALCRGFRGADRSLLQTRCDTRLYIRDLATYIARYFVKRFQLRVEEVLTFDYRRFTDTDSISRAIERLRVFDEEQTCIATRALLRKRLIFRMDNWDCHVTESIFEDVRLLTSIARDKFKTATPYTPKSLVMRLLRAEFRAMYFVHGKSPAYNFDICAYMFGNGSEVASVIKGEYVSVRLLDDDAKDNDIFLQLYAKDISLPVMKAIRHLWLVTNYVPDERDVDDDNDNCEGRALRHIVTVYATWAYTLAFIKTNALPTVDLAAFACRCFAHYRRIFHISTFSIFYREAISKGHSRIYLDRRTVSARVVADAFINDSPSAMNRVTRLSVDVKDRQAFYQRTLRFVRENVHIVPSALVYAKCPNIGKWAIVERDDDRETMVDDGPLNRAYVKDLLRQIEQECRQRRTANVPRTRSRSCS